jgi:hypothetical protein
MRTVSRHSGVVVSIAKNKQSQALARCSRRKCLKHRTSQGVILRGTSIYPVVPAQAGIQSAVTHRFNEGLDSGLRRNEYARDGVTSAWWKSASGQAARR